MLFARMLNLDYLNNIDENQLDLSENDMTKNINNLSVSMENDKILLRWSDCSNKYWKKSYIVKGENTIPTSVYNGDVIGSYTDKNQYYSDDFVDNDVKENTLYCYRIFTEFENEPDYYSGFKNIFYIYVGEQEVLSNPNELIPAIRIIQSTTHRFVNDDQIAKWDKNFSGNYNDLNGKPNLSLVATSGKYEDLIEKPEFSLVATSGNYNDLIGKPEVSVVAKTGSYNDLLNKPTISRAGETGSYTDLLNTPAFSSVALSGSYTDLSNKPTISNVGRTGSYNDLTDKPTISTAGRTGSYNDLTDKPDVYTKTEVDTKISQISGSAPQGPVTSVTNVKRYKADDSGDCYVIASNDGVTFSKSGCNAEIHVPEGVVLLSAQIKFTGDEIGTGSKCTIKYGTEYNYDDNMCMPSYMVLMNNPGSRAYRCAPIPVGNLNLDDGNKLELTNLPSSQPIMVKLTF